MDLVLVFDTNPITLSESRTRIGFGAEVILSRYICALFTRQGSDPMNQERGTGWLDALDAGSSDFQSLADAAHAANQKAVADVIRTQRAAGSPPEESLSAAVVDSIEVLGDDVVLTVRVTDARGNVAVYGLR